ncbi:Glycine C-acetyltransferase [Azospirillaceae bacterium]
MNEEMDDALVGSLRDYAEINGVDLLERIEPFYVWQEKRRQHRLWPYSRALCETPKTSCAVIDDKGHPLRGINFASQDYLSLSSHPHIRAAAIEAITQYGVHSAGSAALQGNTCLSLQLEAALAEKLAMEHVVLYPTGWGAGFGVINGFVRENDYIAIDVLSHACLQSGANAATRNVRRFRHNDVNHLTKILRDIRSNNKSVGIMVVTESLFSMDSDVPDLTRFQEVCKAFQATLVVDAAHDFGCMGPGGTGVIGDQGLLGKIDLVIGSFSKTFASNGGFVATHSRGLKEYLKCYSSPQTFSNAISPVQAAVVMKACDIVNSVEGDERRASLMRAVTTLRREMMAVGGISCLGVLSPITPIMVGREDVARVASRILNDSGVLANLVEFPAVKKGRARFRFQVQSDHTDDQLALAAREVERALREAKRELSISYQ